MDPTNESPAEYQARIARLGYDFPLEVIEQWLYPHYYNGHTVDTYGWINYRNVMFERVLLSFGDLLDLYVIESFRGRVDSCSMRNCIEDFGCTDENKAFWEANRTWKTPAVLLDVTSIDAAPPWSELCAPLQLVEGHSRLGHLKAMGRLNMDPLGEHEVYLLRLGNPS